MSTQLFFKNKKTGKKFRVVKMDKERNKITLQGDYNPFEEDYSKERFAKFNYELVKEEV